MNRLRTWLAGWRSLTQNERHASTGVILGLLGIVCLLVTSLVMAFDFRGEVIDLKHILEDRCEERVERDRRLVAAAEGDAQFYRDLLGVADDTRTMPGLSRDQLASLERQRAIIAQAQARKQEFVDAGVIGNCNVYQAEAR